MNFKMICRFIGKILLVEAVFMVPALIISLIVGEKVQYLDFYFQ